MVSCLNGVNRYKIIVIYTHAVHNGAPDGPKDCFLKHFVIFRAVTTIVLTVHPVPFQV